MIKINLLPHKKVKAVEKGVLQLRVFAIALTALVIVGLLYGFFKLHSKKSELTEKYAQTSQQLKVLKEKVKEVEGFEKTRKDLEQKLTVIQELQKKRVPMSYILSELNKQTTKNVWFTTLHVGGITFELAGLARDSRSNAEDFFKKLEGANAFYDLKLEDVKEDTSTGGRKFAFKISGRLKGYEQAAPQDTQLKVVAAPNAAPAVKTGK
jgi:type IV pilus assembly protein PilN